ncbi:hypothetical protein [Klebsiella quasipneumoniae]|uniref:hypothetical protein n=1 Tax=Klebsiella quasipneumoniae TaxID=1463165 RepID=UPI00249A7EC6|nr:hypothetical protein [Klebsiella quasipneumoniae]MDI3084852.1 hypothetical protein [Klebsiella quasipneumoniae]
MTDITELAQREKFEAWWEREYKHLESSKYTDAVPHIKYGFWMAYQAGGAELVEALEKSRTQSSKWLEGYHKAVSIGARYEERIAELEEAEQKLCAANVTLDARAELAERRLAEMESRTVKLPDGWQFEECEIDGCENGAIFSVGTGSRNIHLCDKCAHEPQNSRLKKSPLSKRLPFKMSAGIKVEAE